MRLLDYQKSVYSQNGEDGILAKILELLPERDQWCVEFGAWDGQHLSNTYNLVQNAGYSSVMIEGDPKRYPVLRKNHGANAKIFCISAFVGFTKDDGLDTLLATTPIPKNFDVLSIDIDGNDYHTWKATTAYKPKVVVIEFNQTMPSNFEYVQKPDPDINEGCSILSLVRLGKTLGYELVAIMEFNAFFVRTEYYPLFNMVSNDITLLREDTSALTYLVSTYDGKLMIVGRDRTTWHGIKFCWLLRRIPGILQRHIRCYTPLQRVLLSMYKLLLKARYAITLYLKV